MRVLLLCWILMMPAHCLAASFDCGKANSDVERMICDDYELSELDDAVAAEFRAARLDIGDAGKGRISNQQRLWVRQRNMCRDTSCLRDSYKKRRQELQTVRDDSGMELDTGEDKCIMARCTAFVGPGSDEGLWNAANNGDLAAVRAALSKGANVNACGSSYERPLHIAVNSRNTALVRRLLSAGANPNVRNCPGNTPLVVAAYENDVNLASLLLEAGADIELNGGMTPLGMAATHGHIEMLRLLIARGAKPNQASGVSTPLMLAAGNQQAEAVGLLLEAGANPNWTVATGANALFDAVGGFRVVPLKPPEQERVLSVVKLLVQHGADVNARVAGQSALQRARALEATEVATFLVALGARD